MIGLSVSNASGKKRCVCDVAAYLVFLRDAAASAAAVAHQDVSATLDAANVSTTVTYPVALRPACHTGKTVWAFAVRSGKTIWGSLTEGMLALVSARHMMSLRK